MRATLAMVALVATTLVAVSFLVPLALLLRTQVHTQAALAAEQRAAAVVPVVALSTDLTELQQAVSRPGTADRLAVLLPDGQLIGTEHTPADLLNRALTGRQPVSGAVAGGTEYLQPVVLAADRVAVVEEFVPQAELDRGLARAWTVMGLLAAALVGGSVVVADRLGSRVVRASRRLSEASCALGAGQLDARVEPAGPVELHEAGVAFNLMADRVRQLLATERELVADLSHRLRTPLTALRLAAERIGPVPGSPRLTAAIGQLETELDSIIVTARAPLAARPAGAGAADGGTEGDSCLVAELARHRVGFWSVLAEQQGRTCSFEATDEPTTVRLPEDALAAVVDSLVGNVFRHTPEGTGFAVSVRRTAQSVVLAVADGGPGIADPAGALSRGVSSGGSTGLGLDIARSAAESTRGQLRILRSELGGALVEVSLGLAAAEPRRGLRRRWRHRRRRVGR
ncbi:two-component sensor histidine kinase [Streptomyces tateyamensis]|uniref:Signal transduction histidine-protein kinase/phosphatase MprB n=1 Tax=Streptomyces tateyamensis TaxID=565073 RepID=A0A2V4P4V8_9ACTN|nr:HAMP domain-containing sensor histidine kinase [Streptomyces tateyamensis]PYC79533.1 two-component sensor histidine kinase [Streptomyces tateyamensis]